MRVGMIEGRTPKLSPSGGVEAFVPRPNPIKPLGGPFRRWHLTPWKRTEATALLDDLTGSNLGEDEEDDSGTSGMDLLNNLITQAGNVYGARNGMVVARPKPGQFVPAGSGSILGGMNTNTMLLIGAGVLGLLVLPKLIGKR